MSRITAPGLFPTKASPSSFASPSKAEPIPAVGNSAPSHKRMMLRRNKDQVATDLPPKQEQVVPVAPLEPHQAMYDTRLARERQKVLGLLGNWERTVFEIFRSRR